MGKKSIQNAKTFQICVLYFNYLNYKWLEERALAHHHTFFYIMLLLSYRYSYIFLYFSLFSLKPVAVKQNDIKTGANKRQKQIFINCFLVVIVTLVY